MEQKIETGGPAFPAPDLGEHDFGQRGAYWGMTLRDYFAAKAMQGMLAAEYAGTYRPALWANDSYAMADAMLKAREVKHEQG